jgi:hypothetical protein
MPYRKTSCPLPQKTRSRSPKKDRIASTPQGLPPTTNPTSEISWHSYITRLCSLIDRTLTALERPGWIESEGAKGLAYVNGALSERLVQYIDLQQKSTAPREGTPTLATASALLGSIPGRLKRLGLLAETSDGTMIFRSVEMGRAGGPGGALPPNDPKSAVVEREPGTLLTLDDIKKLQREIEGEIEAGIKSEMGGREVGGPVVPTNDSMDTVEAVVVE